MQEENDCSDPPLKLDTSHRYAVGQHEPGRQRCCPCERDAVGQWGQVLHPSLTAPGHLRPPFPSQMDKKGRTGFVWGSSCAQLFLQRRMS